MVTEYFRKVRAFFARNYHQQVRVDGEKAMDTLMGTMIGVLFLAIISASFAGIFMAYTVSSAKATENSARNNIVVKNSTNSLNGLYVESVNGKTAATAAGWQVLSHNKALSLASPSLTPDAAFANYTYAAKRPLVDGGKTMISQWGKNENGLVTIYTAIPKAGNQTACDWTATPVQVESSCIVAIDRIQSVVAPPVGVKDENSIRWEEQINKAPWTANAFDWSADTKRDVKTTKLGTITTNGVNNFKYVVMFDNLQPGKEVSLDFVNSKDGAISTHSFTPTLTDGETGNVTRSNKGTISLPDGTTTFDVYIDTDVTQSNTSLDPTVKMYRFVIYNMKTTTP